MGLYSPSNSPNGTDTGALAIGSVILPAAATIAVGAEAANVINVTVQLEDGLDNDLATVAMVSAYLSDNADGSTIAGTAPDGGVAIGTDGLLIPLIAGKRFDLVSEADGDIDIDITETGADTWYLVVKLATGGLEISDAITFAA